MLTKENILEILNNNNQPYLSDGSIRSTVLEYLEHSELPTLKTETWKHTSIKDIVSQPYNMAKYGFINPQAVIEQLLVQNILTNTAVLINGHYQPEGSQIVSQNKGLIITGMAEAKKLYPQLLQQYYESTNVACNDFFTAINTAFATNGLFIYIPENQIIEHPIEIINLYENVDYNSICLPRNLIIAAPNSQVKIIEANYSISKSVNSNTSEDSGLKAMFASAVTEIAANENSGVEYNLIQSVHNKTYIINTTKAVLQSNSRFNNNVFTMYGKLIRNQLIVNLNGENAQTQLNGLYVPKDNNVFDNYISISHSKPNCTSNQSYRGIINNKSLGVFLGKVYVEKNAQKTNAYQSNKNILLSAEASANSKPQLEIYADDVKCSHGSSTGQLDKEQLFYLQSRGISKENSQRLLLHAFASNITGNITIEPFKALVDEMVENILHI